MIEEKTKEPQSQAPQRPVKGREKLRSFWAKVQISGLLRRHRFRRKTQRHMNDVAKKLRASAVVLAFGEALYALGFAAEYMVVRTGRGHCCRGPQSGPLVQECPAYHHCNSLSRCGADVQGSAGTALPVLQGPRRCGRPTPTTCAGSGALVLP